MNQKVKEHIAKQPSPQKEILQKLRRIILKTFPDIKEEWKWGAPVYDSRYYLASLRDSVNMGFSVKGMPEKDKKLFKGSGKMMRHIKIRTLKEIDEKQIVKLMRLVKKTDADCHQ